MDGETYEALFAADQAEQGVWPLAGGWLDQTQNCLDAVNFTQAEMSSWKASLGIVDG